MVVKATSIVAKAVIMKTTAFDTTLIAFTTMLTDISRTSPKSSKHRRKNCEHGRKASIAIITDFTTMLADFYMMP